MTFSGNHIPFVGDFPMYSDVADSSFNGNAAVGNTTPIATQTVPAMEFWVLRFIFVKLRDGVAINDMAISFVIVRNGITTTIRFENGITDTYNFLTDLKIVLRVGDTITVTAVNNTAGNIAISAAYMIDIYKF